jgi:hemoglobin
MADADPNIHDLVGGLPAFEKLVDHFYDAAERDPVLRPMYPEDLTESRKHLAMFLSQFFGGPPEYSNLRGHPRLRARHLPFVIGPKERNAWVRHMVAAVDLAGIGEPAKSHLNRYFEEAATFMINQ